MSTEEVIPKLRTREEAAPVAWDRLTPQQRRAAVRVWALLRSELESERVLSRFSEREQGGQLGRVLPPIAAQRHNLTILIDGRRGSGKTAVLVSLIDQWNRRAERPDPRARPPAPTPDVARGYEELSDPCGRLIPIGLLNLRSLPPTTSLTMHVASLLRELVRLSEVDDASPRMPLRPRAVEVPAPRRAWDAFVRAAAALELRFQTRGPQLDPESFAVELRDAERDRLDLNERVCELLDSLVVEFRRQHADRGAPLFLIAIDDADMNPKRALETFELVERFQHPRLAFLLTGDQGSFGPILRARFLADFRGSLRGIPVRDLELARLEDIEQTENLAKFLYDKVIPPAHHCRLPPVASGDRLAHLRPELEALPLAHPLFPSVAHLFDALPELTEALPLTMRELIDLATQLRGTDLPGLARLCWEECVATEAGPGGELARALDLFDVRDDVLDNEMLTIKPLWDELRAIELTSRDKISFSSLQGFTVTIDSQRRRELRKQSNKREPSENDPIELSRRLSAAYLLVHEADVLAGGPRLRHRAWKPGWKHEFVVADLRSRLYSHEKLPWPIPHWPSLATLRSLSKRWRQTVNAWTELSAGLLLERAGPAFVEVVRTVALASEVSADIGLSTWQECFTSVYQTLPDPASSVFAAEYRAWVRGHLLHFANPESGLGERVARQVEGAFSTTATDDYRDFVRSQSARTDYWETVQARRHGFAGIPDMASNYRNRDFVSTYYQSAEATLFEAMTGFPVELDSQVRGPWVPATLLGYVPEVVRERLRSWLDVPSIDQFAQTFASLTKTDALDGLKRAATLLRDQVSTDIYWLSQGEGDRDRLVAGREKDPESGRGFSLTNSEKMTFSVQPGALKRDYHNLNGLGFMFHYLLYSVYADRYQRFRDSTSNVAGWECFVVNSRFIKSEAMTSETPWCWPNWRATLDHLSTVVAWNELRELEKSPDELAQAFVSLNLMTFERATGTSECKDWYALVKSCSDKAREYVHHRSQRALDFRGWVDRLHEYARPTALLSETSAATVIIACRDLGLLAPKHMAEDPHREQFIEHMPEHPWSRLLAAGEDEKSFQATIEALRGAHDLPSASSDSP